MTNEALRRRIQRTLRRKAKEREAAARKWAKQPQPRYDEVYWEGVRWMEENG